MSIECMHLIISDTRYMPPFLDIPVTEKGILLEKNVHGFQSRDETAMLVYKTMAKFRSSFA